VVHFSLKETEKQLWAAGAQRRVKVNLITEESCSESSRNCENTRNGYDEYFAGLWKVKDKVVPVLN
jgi:hypothetical protein